MTAVELDPIFIKANRLLHSKAKDSGAQLKKLLDDVIAERKRQKSSSGESKSSSSKSYKPEVERQKSHKSDHEREKKREAEKRTLDKIKKETKDSDDEVIPEKKPRHDSPQPVAKPKTELLQPDLPTLSRPKKESPKPGHSPSHDVKIKEEPVIEKDKPKPEKKTKEDDMDADEFAIGLGISCVVCKSFDVTSRNQLVECQECHSLYHQECHKPPVTEQDVNDPRFVWYCCRCSKNMKKMVQSKTTKTKPPSTTSVKDSTMQSNKKSDPASLFSFRRVETKVPTTPKDQSNNVGAKPLSGLASLAANLSGKSEQSKSHSQSSKTDQSKSSSQSVKSEQSKSFSLPGKLDQSKSSQGTKSDQSKSSSSQSKNIFSKFDQMEKVSLLSGAKYSGKAESAKSSSPSTPKLELMKTLSSKLSPDAIKPALKTETSKPVSNKSMPAPSKPHNSQGGTSAVVNAEKKLQMMKKKAAAKLQEKRASFH